MVGVIQTLTRRVEVLEVRLSQQATALPPSSPRRYSCGSAGSAAAPSGVSFESEGSPRFRSPSCTAGGLIRLQAPRIDSSWAAETTRRLQGLEKELESVRHLAEQRAAVQMKAFVQSELAQLVDGYLQAPLEQAREAMLLQAREEIEELKQGVADDSNKMLRAVYSTKSNADVDQLSQRVNLLRDEVELLEKKMGQAVQTSAEALSEEAKSRREDPKPLRTHQTEAATHELRSQLKEELQQQHNATSKALSLELSSKASLDDLSDLRRAVSSVLSKSHSNGSRTDEQLITIRDTMKEIQRAIKQQRHAPPVDDQPPRQAKAVSPKAVTHPVGLRPAPLHERLLVAHTPQGQVSS
ncbi:MAG: hypothetical protein SGPRY_014153, partial [Prymnesium sp.]